MESSEERRAQGASAAGPDSDGTLDEQQPQQSETTQTASTHEMEKGRDETSINDTASAATDTPQGQQGSGEQQRQSLQGSHGTLATESSTTTSLLDSIEDQERGIMDPTEEEDMQREVRMLALADPVEDEQLEPGAVRSISPPPPFASEGVSGTSIGAAMSPSDEISSGVLHAGEDTDEALSTFEPVLASETSATEEDGASATQQDQQDQEGFLQQQQEPPAGQQWPDIPHRSYGQHGALDASGLGDLRNAVNSQKSAARIYSYPTNADTDSLVNEIDEFYSYVEAPQFGENRAAWEEWCEMESKGDTKPSSRGDAEQPGDPKQTYSGALGLGLGGDAGLPETSQEGAERDIYHWTILPTSARRRKIQTLLTLLEVKDPEARVRTSRALLYLLQGSFADTHGSEHQLQWIQENSRMVRAAGGLGEIFSALKVACWKHDWLSSLPDEIPSSEPRKEGQEPPEPLLNSQMKSEYLDEINLELALHFAQLYILVETQRGDEEWGDELMSLDPPLPIYLFTLVSALRDKNAKGYPVKKLLLLVWKCILSCFGGFEDVKRCKDFARELEGLPPVSEVKDQKSQPLITKATPIDFQNFQEELSIKYPTYDAARRRVGDLPLDKIASAVTPIPPRKSMANHDPGNTGVNTGGFTSTPAPSPPPSPKPNKQKYQTDQNRPFIFPYSKSVQGSRLVPHSIEEASRLYRNNMYVSLELWQLWRLREEAIQEERGVANAADGSRIGFGAWDKDQRRHELLASLAEEASEDSRSPIASELPGSTHSASGGNGGDRVRGEPTVGRLEIIERELDAEFRRAESDHMLAVIDNEKYMGNLERLRKKRADAGRLQRVDILYRAVLPYLQNTIIVMLKLLLAIVTQQNDSNSPYFQALAEGIAVEDAPAPTLEDIDIVRHREITSKSICGIILLLLKWFKVSHVMKFNYISQLLVDSNCLLLILKMHGLVEVSNQVKVINEIPNFNFFRFCALNCGREPRKPQPEDTALARQPFEGLPSPPLALSNLNTSIDEYEYMNRYSFRNFYCALSFTRILQKLTKRKTHRILLLVQYKSSAILKRSLKVPHPDLQLYALKVIKSQVPFCGRKWRQSNMKVITAIYLRCRPDLRDEWLSGADIDGDVEESLPQEQALRSLIKYYNQTRIGTPSALPSPASGTGHGHRRSLSTSLAGQTPEDMQGDGMNGAGMLGGPGFPMALHSPTASTKQNLSFFESETLPPLRRAPESTAGTRRYIPDDLLEGYLDDYEDLIGELFGQVSSEADRYPLSQQEGALHGLTRDGSRAAWGVLNQMLGEGDAISDSESVGSEGIMARSEDGTEDQSSAQSGTAEGEEGAQTWEQLSPEAMRYLTSNRPVTPGSMRRRASQGSDGGRGDSGTDLVPGSPNIASPLRPVLGVDGDPLDDESSTALSLNDAATNGGDEDDDNNEQDQEPLPEPTAGGIDEVEHVWGS